MNERDRKAYDCWVFWFLNLFGRLPSRNDAAAWAIRHARREMKRRIEEQFRAGSMCQLCPHENENCKLNAETGVCNFKLRLRGGAK